MQTSPRGVAFLEREEGVVLRAYLCPAGRWTIGAGLTAASGVVVPRPGMVITAGEATALLQAALRKNYEPAVAAALPQVEQHAFDAGVSFHFNTGAIDRASWVSLFRKGAGRTATMAALRQWRKGGGKVLPGLERRREKEGRILFDGVYPGEVSDLAPAAGFAVWALPLSRQEMADARAAMAGLGYEVGSALDAILVSAVRAFQADHGLTVDGKIGRATLSTLQRRIDARSKAVPALGATTTAGAAGAASVSGADDALHLAPWIVDAVLVAGILYGLYFAFTYRDVIAAAIQRPLPRLAAILRSF